MIVEDDIGLGLCLNSLPLWYTPDADHSSQVPSAPSLADEALVRRLLDGETAAGEILVQRYHQPLMRYLQRLAGSDHLAEELHQQTWLSVLDHLGKFDARSSNAGNPSGSSPSPC